MSKVTDSKFRRMSLIIVSILFVILQSVRATATVDFSAVAWIIQAKSIDTVSELRPVDRSPRSPDDLHTVYLPIIRTPLLIGGEIKLAEGQRAKGVTAFVNTVELDLSDITLPSNPAGKPEQMRVWVSPSPEPDIWEPYNDEVNRTLVSGLYGMQVINARFAVQGVASDIVEFAIFYIPNGDFQDPNPGSGWSLIDNEGLGWEIITGDTPRLRLGNAGHSCLNGVPLGATIAFVDLYLQQSNNYRFRIEGTMYTQDRNHNNTNAFDAFEILVNGQLWTRVRNPSLPPTCNEMYEFEVDESIPLSPYQGLTRFNFENHNRLDRYYNTYTDITAIWIEKLP
jgi:hypothetical protein